jgi:hypothetical protein
MGKESPGLESISIRGYAAFFSIWVSCSVCIPGYQRTKVSRSRSLSTFVRTWSRLCAPDSLHCICGFFTIRLLINNTTRRVRRSQQNGVGMNLHYPYPTPTFRRSLNTRKTKKSLSKLDAISSSGNWPKLPTTSATLEKTNPTRQRRKIAVSCSEPQSAVLTTICESLKKALRGKRPRASLWIEIKHGAPHIHYFRNPLRPACASDVADGTVCPRRDLAVALSRVNTGRCHHHRYLLWISPPSSILKRAIYLRERPLPSSWRTSVENSRVWE